MPSVGDTVMVIYHGPQEKYKIGWDGRERDLVKNTETFIPFEMACNWFGDPRSVGTMTSVRDHKNTVGWVPDRATEVRRLRIVYGVQHGNEAKIYLDESIPLPEDSKQAAHWRRIDSTIPRVELYDLETRDRLYTVLEDPSGDHVTPASKTVTVEQQQAEKIDRLEKLVENLVANQRPTHGVVLPGPAGQGQAVAPPPLPPMPGMARPDEPETNMDNANDQSRELIDSQRSGAAGLPADGS